MNPDPDLIHYVCIAKGSTVLAEFNSRDAELEVIASKCLDNTPSYHASFTHTVRTRTYTFLIDDSFVYFAIFDERFEKSNGLAFLNNVRDAFSRVFYKGFDSFGSHCFQGELNPVFRGLMGSGLSLDLHISSPRGDRLGQNGILSCEPSPIRGRNKPTGGKGLKKMKNRIFGVARRDEEDECSGMGLNTSRDLSSSPMMCKHGGSQASELLGNQKAKKVWKKQVWIVLSLDLIICVILFAVWLWVCIGFKCIYE